MIVSCMEEVSKIGSHCQIHRGVYENERKSRQSLRSRIQGRGEGIVGLRLGETLLILRRKHYQGIRRIWENRR